MTDANLSLLFVCLLMAGGVVTAGHAIWREVQRQRELKRIERLLKQANDLIDEIIHNRNKKD